MLTVIAVISILIAITLPAILHARESTRRMTCQNNLKQIMLGALQFESSHKKFPNSDRPLRDLLSLIDPPLAQQASQQDITQPPPAIYGCPSDFMLPQVYGRTRFS
jgi:competence protein ComGC